jgi:hypothetical protein
MMRMMMGGGVGWNWKIGEGGGRFVVVMYLLLNRSVL